MIGTWLFLRSWRQTSMPEMRYNLVSTGPAGEDGGPTEPGYIGGGMLSREDPVTSPVIVLAVTTSVLLGAYGLFSLLTNRRTLISQAQYLWQALRR